MLAWSSRISCLELIKAKPRPKHMRSRQAETAWNTMPPAPLFLARLHCKGNYAQCLDVTFHALSKQVYPLGKRCVQELVAAPRTRTAELCSNIWPCISLDLVLLTLNWGMLEASHRTAPHHTARHRTACPRARHVETFRTTVPVNVNALCELHTKGISGYFSAVHQEDHSPEEESITQLLLIRTPILIRKAVHAHM